MKKKTISLLLVVSLTLSLFAFSASVAGADVLASDTVVLGQQVIQIDKGYTYYAFTPDKDSLYIITTEGSDDTVGCICDSEGEQIREDDDNGEGNNFFIKEYLYAGRTYYVGVKSYISSAKTTLVISEYVGSCGDNLTWKLEGNTLTISGTGTMKDYSYDTDAPWYSSKASIYSVIIESGVTSIGDSAFSSCRSLESIKIPNSVTHIGDSAFRYCSSLESVTIPSSVTSIGNSAFYDCSSLTSVTIPNGVTSIGDSAFYYCSSLTSVTIPNGVTSIGDSAFSGCRSLTSITIPNGVTNIGDLAFGGCSSLTSITIPNGVTSIGVLAFSGCSNLTSITIPNGVTSIGDSAFSGCSNLTSITIPNGVTSIESYAFSYCSNLTSVTIPDSVTSIGDRAFYDCSSLESVTIPDSVTSIGNSAFRDCSSLEAVYYAGTEAQWKAIDICANNAPLIQAERCYRHTHQYISERVVPPTCTNRGYTVHTCAYGDTMRDTYVSSLGVSHTHGSSDSGIVTSPTCTVQGYTTYICTRCGDSYEDDAVPALGHDYVYGACTRCGKYEPIATGECGSSGGSLKWELGRDGVLTISGSGPMKNYRYEQMVDEDECIIIDDTAKRGWAPYLSKVKSVVIEEGVTSIGTSAFAGCCELTSVTIPRSVKSIGNSAPIANSVDNALCWSPFAGCSNIRELHIASVGSWAEVYTTSTVYSSHNAMKGGNYNEGHFSSGPLMASSGTVDLYVGDQLVTDIDIPDGISKIPDYAFSRCNIRSVTIPDSVKEIGRYAFYNCGSLTEINYNARAVENSGVGIDVFSNSGASDSGIKVTFGVDVKKIPGNLFKNTSKLDSPKISALVFAGNVPQIDNFAFANVTATAYYPYGNNTWTAAVMKDYGGHITWKQSAPLKTPSVTVDYLVSTGKPYVKWNAVKGATEYEVYRAGSKTGTPVKIGTTDKLNFTDTTAGTGYGYYYTVKAVVANGGTSKIGELKFGRCHCPKPVVTADYLTVSGKPYLKWNAVEKATKYEIYRAGSKDGTYTKIGTTTSTHYTDTKAGTGYGYYYKVKAICSVSASGNSYYSDAVFGRCHCPKPVVTPDYLSSSGKPYLKWNAVEKAAKYEIYRAGSKTGTYTKIATTTATNYTDTTAGTGSGYYYKVKAVSSVSTSGNSYYSEIVFARCHCARPVVTITTSNGHPLVKWSAVTGAASYDVYRSTDGKTFVKYTSTTGTSWTNSSASAGTTYYYKVVAVCGASQYANSAYSTAVSIRAK